MRGFAAIEAYAPKLFPRLTDLLRRHGVTGISVIAVCFFAIRATAVAIGMGVEVNTDQAPIGGDFITFWVAAQTILTPMQAMIYSPDVFVSVLVEAFPWCQENCQGLYWNYPPTYSLLLAPLKGLPLPVAYALFMAGSATVFAAGLIRAGVRGAGLIFVLTSGTMLSGMVTGQNGFLTGGLLILALTTPARTPLVAGIAAGLLTVKPQLGILLPFAFMAGGHWKAFIIASVTAVTLAAASVAAFGVDVWVTFFETLFNKWDAVAAGGLDRLLVTPMAALSLLGVPAGPAFLVQISISVVGIVSVLHVWRADHADWLKTAWVLVLVPIVTPHAFYYELTGPLAALALFLVHARRDGWREGERAMLALFWAGTCFLPVGYGVPLPLGTMIAGLAVLVIAQRLVVPVMSKSGQAPRVSGHCISSDASSAST